MRCIWSGSLYQGLWLVADASARPLIGWHMCRDKTMETLEMDGHWWHRPGPGHQASILRHLHQTQSCKYVTRPGQASTADFIRHFSALISFHSRIHAFLFWLLFDLLTRVKMIVTTFSWVASVYKELPCACLPLSIICLCSDLMFSWQYCVSASVTWYYCDNIYCGRRSLLWSVCCVIQPGPSSRKLLYRAIQQTAESVRATITEFLYWSGCSKCVFSSDRNNERIPSNIDGTVCKSASLWVWTRMIVW